MAVPTVPITPAQLEAGLKHVCYEHVSLLAGAWEMTNPAHVRPINLLIQDATLVHLRAMAEFFHFSPDDGPLPKTLPRDRPDAKAIFYCQTAAWNPLQFDRSSKLMKALDKCLAHLSLARELTIQNVGLSVAWDGPTHLHGTMKLMLTTWDQFQIAVLPQFVATLDRCLKEAEKTVDFSITDFDLRFDAVSRQRQYTLGQLP